MNPKRAMTIALTIAGTGAIVAVTVTLIGQDPQRPPGVVSAPNLPQTPAGWLDAYVAARAGDPARVCRDLFTRRLRDRVRLEMHENCVTLVRRQGPTALRLVRMQTHGTTTVIDVYLPKPRRYTAAVLVRERGGLRAFQFIPRTGAPGGTGGEHRHSQDTMLS